MSENEIKPIAWMLECQNMGNGTGWKLSWTRSGAGVCLRLNGEAHEVALYDQSAIDRLLEKIDRLEMIESSWLEFMGKTDWVQTASEPHELGKHRADVLKDRIDRLTAERDAAVADAERYRFLRNAPTEIPAAGVEVAIWDDGEGEAIRGAELDVAIDAARAEGGV